jgi:hypothetical protein
MDERFIVALFLVVVMFDARTARAQDAAWTFGGFADIAYLFAPNDPFNQAFRGRGTAWHLNDPFLNMAGIYARRPSSSASRLGGEVMVHGGKDAELFGFSATAPRLSGANWLRHLGPTNVTYLADIGKGLTVQGGVFSSLIGYDSLYARDNVNYTRPWGADFTPYLMLGVNASYPLTDKVTATAFIVNGYWHLAEANSVPSFGGQVSVAISPRFTFKESIMAGPHQPETAFRYWRFLSDSIVEHKTDRFVIALNGHFATEPIAPAASIGTPGNRAWWFAAQVPMQWHAHGPWRIALRPEVARDSTGRWTLAEQTVKAFTATVEYRAAFKSTATSVKLEYRVDNSTGAEGGFFTDREDEMTSTEHLWIAAVVFRFDRTQSLAKQ